MEISRKNNNYNRILDPQISTADMTRAREMSDKNYTSGTLMSRQIDKQITVQFNYLNTYEFIQLYSIQLLLFSVKINSFLVETYYIAEKKIYFIRNNNIISIHYVFIPCLKLYLLNVIFSLKQCKIRLHRYLIYKTAHLKNVLCSQNFLKCILKSINNSYSVSLLITRKMFVFSNPF